MSSRISEHLKGLNKNNLHHAYLIEGERSEIVSEIIEFIESLGIKKSGNPDFYNLELDSFKVDDARNLKSYGSEKSTTSAKKIFLISANSFLLEAQNTLLKMLEEPIQNTHFFIVVPDTNALLPTFVSRFYLIRADGDMELKEAEKFISMPMVKRIDFIKELLTEPEEEDEDLPAGKAGGNEIPTLNSARSRALKFLNALELVLHRNSLENFERRKSHPVIGEGSRRQNFPENCFCQIFQVRKFLRMPGSSAKSLMESVALNIPDF